MAATQTEKAVFVNGEQYVIDYTPNADVAAGDVIDLGTMVGIATRPILANTLGGLAITGVFDILKHTGETFALGDPVYWDVSDTFARNNVSYSDDVMGLAVKAAASGDASVRVYLTPYIT